MLSYFFLGSIFFFAYFFFNLLAKIFNLYDYPNNRKIHNQPIPFTGGLIIITTLLIYIPFVDLDNQLFLIILSSLPLVVIGTIDDIIPQRVSIRVLIQILCSLFLIGGPTRLLKKSQCGSNVRHVCCTDASSVAATIAHI